MTHKNEIFFCLKNDWFKKYVFTEEEVVGSSPI